MHLEVREAESKDIGWINQQYSDIGFKLSDFESEKILILNADGKPAAIGRLVHITTTSAELGGIYVLPEFRGRKFAERIVRDLLNLKHSYSQIYCLPFSKLENFYKRFGFRDVLEYELNGVPEKIKTKLQWCHRTYKDETVLLARNA